MCMTFTWPYTCVTSPRSNAYVHVLTFAFNPTIYEFENTYTCVWHDQFTRLRVCMCVTSPLSTRACTRAYVCICIQQYTNATVRTHITQGSFSPARISAPTQIYARTDSPRLKNIEITMEFLQLAKTHMQIRIESIQQAHSKDWHIGKHIEMHTKKCTQRNTHAKTTYI